MRSDIEALNSHFSHDLTVQKFGEPENNNSQLVCQCTGADCDSVIYCTVIRLKARIKNAGGVYCNPCIGKRSWTNSKRAKIAALWKNPAYKMQISEARKKQWQSLEQKARHRNGCLKSYDGTDRRKKVVESTTKLWKDPSFRDKIVASKRALWQTESFKQSQRAFKTPRFRKLQSEKQKKNWEDPEYRENQVEKQKSVWLKDGYRNQQSLIQKKVWNRKNYRKHRSIAQIERWKNSEYRAFYETLWSNMEYRQRLSEITKKIWQNDKFRSKASERSKALWHDNDYRDKVISKLRKLWEDPKYREQASIRSKEMWEDSVFRDKMGIARAAQSGRKSSIELMTEFILDGLGIRYEFQIPVGHYLFDFFLPEHRAFIECQGEYWHSLPGKASRDAGKATYLEKSRPNDRLLYLNERDFLNPTFVVSKINSFLTEKELILEQTLFKLQDVVLRLVKPSDVAGFLNSFHYGRYGRSAKLAYGAFLNDKLIAVCKFSPPIRKEVATSMALQPREVLELDRFCVHPRYQKKNFASWVLSRLTKDVFKRHPEVSCLVSFADSTYGHTGVIYRASGWKETSQVAPDYHYVNDDGFVLHKKTLYNHARKMGQKERQYADANGYARVFGRKKIKFTLTRSKI